MITHLLFVDDSILFGEATNQGGQIVQDILQSHERASSQKVNLDKSLIYFNNNVTEEVRHRLTNGFGKTI